MRSALYRGYAALRAGRLLRDLRGLERSQWLSRDELEALQVGKLRALLEHAARHVPYYGKLFRQTGFDPSAVRTTGALRRLPPLDRETLIGKFDLLRDNRRAEAGGGTGASMLRSTGGSTGRPLRFLVDRREMTLRSAHIYRNLGWLGWQLGDRTAYVWGSDIDARDHRGWRGALRDGIAGVLWLDAFRMEERDLDAQLDTLRRFDPAVVIGYPSSLHLLARRALVTGRQLKLRGIETSAETLLPEVRRDLGEAFGCAILDRYGCREAGVIAHECPAGGMHVNAEAVLAEVEDGQVLVTTLNNLSMPLIRYRVEDLAEPGAESCVCGRGLPLLRDLRGRISDIIRSPSGRLIHGEFFTHLFYGATSVRAFQVEQTSAERLEIRYVSAEGFDAQARAEIETSILTHGDKAFVVAWSRVEAIKPGPSGKFRFTIARPGQQAGEPSDTDGPGERKSPPER